MKSYVVFYNARCRGASPIIGCYDSRDQAVSICNALNKVLVVERPEVEWQFGIEECELKGLGPKPGEVFFVPKN